MSFQFKIITPAMLDEAHDCELDAWESEEKGAASRDLLEKRVTRFPLGNFAAVGPDGRMLGTVWSVAIDPIQSVSTWKEATGDGEYANGNPYGEMGFGVNVAVRKEFAGRKIGNHLIAHVVDLAFRCGRSYFRFGSRLPDYRAWHQVFDAEDFARLLVADGNPEVFFRADGDSGIRKAPDLAPLKAAGARVNPREWPLAPLVPEGLEAFDEGMRFFLRVMPEGFGPPRIFKVQPGYFADEDSLNFGVIMGWDRP